LAHITFVHGLANKPSPEELIRRWKSAISKAVYPLDLGAESISCEMVYWADVLYEKPLSDNDFETFTINEALEIPESPPALRLKGKNEDEAMWIAAMSDRLGLNREIVQPIEVIKPTPNKTITDDMERIPLPGFVKDELMRTLLRDLHHYLFNVVSRPRLGSVFNVQDEIRSRFVQAIEIGKAKPGPHIVISHSMGTIIAYDCLKRVKECPPIDGLITIGSPLGIDEIQDEFKPEWTRRDGFPSNNVRTTWLNIYDPLDVVSMLDAAISNDFKKKNVSVIEDISQSNSGVWRHDIEKYLIGSEVSAAIGKLLEV